MVIVVASSNIFRRELASYHLAEAGHEVHEARTAEGLLDALRDRAPALAVIDQQIERDAPEATLRAVRQLGAAPIVWIADPERMGALPGDDGRPAAAVAWPFRGDELVATVATLLARDAEGLADCARGARDAEHAPGAQRVPKGCRS